MERKNKKKKKKWGKRFFHCQTLNLLWKVGHNHYLKIALFVIRPANSLL